MINFVDAFLVSYLYAAYPNGGLLKWGVALFIIHFGRIFHEINHPATGVPLFAGRPHTFWEDVLRLCRKASGLFVHCAISALQGTQQSFQASSSILAEFLS